MKILLTSGIFLIINFWLVAQTTYYISNDGNDSNDGTSPSSPWRTISHINSLTFVPGDSILFKAGGIWRENLIIKDSGSKNNYIVFSRYGSGKNPQIVGSEKATCSAQSTLNIWRSNESFADPRSTNNGRYPSEIFFVDKNDSVSWGTFKSYSSDFANLTNNLDWTWSNNTIYIYLTSDPSSSYSSIEVPQRQDCISIPDHTMANYICFDGIDILFSQSKGFNAGYPALRGAIGFTYRNSRIGYIGEKNGSAAYGITGFQSNFIVENCTFSDCGRRAISFATYLDRPEGSERIMKNIIIRNNIFKRGWHSTALDLETGGNNDSATDIYFYNNIIDDSDLGPECASKRSNQIFIQEYDGYINNLYIFNNLFIQASGRNILIEDGDTVHIWNNTIVGHNPNTFVSSVYSNVSFNYTLYVDYRNNILYSNWPNNGRDNWGVLMQHDPSVYITCDNNIYYQEYQDPNHNGVIGGKYGYYTIDQWDTYRSRNPNLDPHSPRPANPQFLILYKDLHISPTSPAKGAGTPVSHVFTDPEGNTVLIGSFDIDGIPRSSTNPSIGAYEYIDPDLSQATIIYFTIAGQESSSIDNDNHTINITMPYGTDLTNLVPAITISYGASISPLSGTTQDFSTPVQYTVTSGDGSNRNIYIVSVTTGSPPKPPPSSQDSLKISLSPNPADDNVQVTIIGDLPAETYFVRIFTMPGNVVYQSELYNGNKQLTIPEIKYLRPGSYIIEVVFDYYQSATNKLIISR